MAEEFPKIRAFQIEDYDEVFALWRATSGIGLDKSDTRECTAAYLERNPGLSLVATDAAGKIVGAVLCGHDGRRGWLYHLAVADSSRGRGLGRTLVERCLANLGKLGITKCSLGLYATNTAGQLFWRKMKFNVREDLLFVQKVL